MLNVDHKKNIVEVKNVFFSYNRENVLENISLEIHKGDYLGMIGPNGAGKTTLLKIMLGLLEPQMGEVKLFGKNIKEFKDWKKIGYIPQKVTNFDLNFPLTVYEVVIMGCYGKKALCCRVNACDRKVAEEALKRVDMLESKDRLIGDLSPGQQQRVFIARALAGEPEIIFLDEPTTGVDEKTQNEFYSLLKKLNQELSLTLVLISHDIGRIANEVMHIACIDKILVCHSTPEEYLKDNLPHHH